MPPTALQNGDVLITARPVKIMEAQLRIMTVKSEA